MSELVRAAFDNAAEVLNRLSTTANMKETRERLPLLAKEVRAIDDPSPLLPELAEQLDSMAEELASYPSNNKKDVGPKLAPLVNWLTEHRPVDAVAAANRVEEIERQINALMTSAATSVIRVGGLLREAREEYGKKDTKAFFAWAEGNFGFKKAYVYRLMQVHEKFGDDPLLSGASIHALAALTHADPDKIAEARKLAEEGHLTNEAVKKLTGKDKPAKAKQPAEEVPPKVEGGGTQESRGEYVGKETTENPDKQPGEVRDATIQHLNEVIAELREELRAARESQEKTKRQSKGQALPSLPQFKSKSYAARLGLASEEATDASAIREAFRGLVKAGYGEGHPDFPAIEEARKELAKQAEQAA